MGFFREKHRQFLGGLLDKLAQLSTPPKMGIDYQIVIDLAKKR